MLAKTLIVTVHCQPDTLWNLLLERLQNPERFTPGVTETRFTDKQDNVMVREMMLHGERVKERITVHAHESEILHELLEHPQFTGTIRAQVVRTARQSPVAPQQLPYDLELLPKSRLVEGVVYGEAEIVVDLEVEMQRLKSRAEEIDSRA